MNYYSKNRMILCFDMQFIFLLSQGSNYVTRYRFKISC